MTTVFKPRSAWTSQPRGGAALAPRGVIGMASHWPGSTSNAYGVESEAKVAARLRGWWEYHVRTRGWADIGYNFAIDQAGRVWDLRGSGRVGAHAASAGNPDANHEWIGVLHILGDEERPSAAMVQAHYDLWDLLEPKFPNMDDERGHGQVPGAQTSCPGQFVRQMLAAGRPSQPPTPPTPEPPEEEDDVTTLVSEYGSTQFVMVDTTSPYVLRLSERTFNALKKTPGIKYQLLTNAQTNMYISLQGYRERRLRAVLWSETVISRDGKQIPVLQELANIRTELLWLIDRVGGSVKSTDVTDQIRALDSQLKALVEKVGAQVGVTPPMQPQAVSTLLAAREELRPAAVEVPTELPPAEEVMPEGLEHEPDEDEDE